MRTTTKAWDETTPAEALFDQKQRRINRTCKPNGTNQKKRRLNVRRGGR